MQAKNNILSKANFRDKKFHNHSSKNFTILHQNVQHLPSRMDLLEVNLVDINPCVLALSEHKMKDCELDCLNINGYNVCSYLSRKLTTGGGVILLTSKNIC